MFDHFVRLVLIGFRMKNFNIKGIALKVGGGWGGLRQFADLGGGG